MNDQKSIAIIYDKFTVHGGGERVCQMLLEAFPKAKLYALNANPRRYWEDFYGRKIHTAPFSWIFSNRLMVTILYPVAALLMSRVEVNEDITLAYSSTCGKFARINSKKKVLYSNYPNRGVYQSERIIKNAFIRIWTRPLISLMKFFEIRQLQKFDCIVSISSAAREAMIDFAGLDSTIIMPPCNRLNDHIEYSSNLLARNDSYLLVSRLEPEKDIEYVIDAFNISKQRLTIIGDGSQLAEFRKKALPNITFLGYVSDCRLDLELRTTRALVFPSNIEYSLVPLEAISVGTPVISYGSEIMKEILIDAESEASISNAVFYREMTPRCLNSAIGRFNKLKWDHSKIEETAKTFKRADFIHSFHNLIFNSFDS